MTVLLVGALAIGCLGGAALMYWWRVRVLRELRADLMRLVRERTEQLEAANRKLEHLSYLDALTGVSNRRFFDEALATEWRRSARTRTPLSLLMVDIDAFKALNDVLGHQAGDECLHQVAQAIATSVGRASDAVARYGGEEFAVLLPGTDGAGAETLAERIRAAVESRALRHPGWRAGHVTVSIGVAALHGSDRTTPDALVCAADVALYEAKRAGRNQVRVTDAARREVASA